MIHVGGVATNKEKVLDAVAFAALPVATTVKEYPFVTAVPEMTPELDTVSPLGGAAQEYVTGDPSAFAAVSCNEYTPAGASVRIWGVTHVGTLAIVNDNACDRTTFDALALVACTVKGYVPGVAVGVPLSSPEVDNATPAGSPPPGHVNPVLDAFVTTSWEL